MTIDDHTFLITGGGSGLGAATAERLVGGGARVVLADIDEEAVKATAERLGEQAHATNTDVTNTDSVEAAINAAVTRYGGLHGVINCAGIVLGRRTLGKHGPHDLDSFTKVIQVNLVGSFNVIRLAAAVMADNAPTSSGERGVIVNTASIAAFDGQIGQAAYAASKGGIVSLTLPVARDLARNGIRVMTIAPGIFDTPMMASLPEDVRASLAQQIPFPSRLGRPEEYAHLAQHIIENSMLNGEVIRLDGAIRMGPK